MADLEKVIKRLEWILADDKFGFGVNWETGEPRDEYEKAGKIITDAIALLKELDAAYQGATELLRQKTILFDDAIKRLKEQQKRIEQMNYIYGFVYGGQVKEIKELVRCRDCRWGEPTKNVYGEDRIICGNDDTYIDRYITVPADWFCADGERRTDNGQ